MAPPGGPVVGAEVRAQFELVACSCHVVTAAAFLTQFPHAAEKKQAAEATALFPPLVVTGTSRADGRRLTSAGSTATTAVSNVCNAAMLGPVPPSMKAPSTYVVVVVVTVVGTSAE
jgi:hypothetical protein